MGLRTPVPAFDEATAVFPAGDGRYRVRPDERFAIVAGGGKPGAVNGGVLLATVLRAVLDTSPYPHPVATSAHFLRVPRTEPAEVQVTWLRKGMTAATARASMSQDGAPVLEATVTAGTLGSGGAAGGGGMSWTGEPPVLPPISQCVGFSPHPGGELAGFARHVDVRLDPATMGWLRGEPSGVPEMRGYFQLREDRGPDGYMLALAVDALPPVVFGLGPVGWSPTVELTWHMRAVPVAGPLRLAARCRHVSGGWFDEEVEVWDEAGQLAAQSRQIARVGRRRRSRPDAAAEGTGAPEVGPGA